MAPTPQNGFFVSWEQVMAFFAMAEEALKAKSAANEVDPRMRAPSSASVARSDCGCTIGCLPALQVLRRDGEGVKEELEEKRSAYIKGDAGSLTACCILAIADNCSSCDKG